MSSLTTSAYSLSALQQGMLFHHLSAPGSGVDIEQIVCTLPEAVDVALLQDAWGTVMRRHDVLRTGFRWQDAAPPSQEVHPDVALPFEVREWSATRPDAREARLAEFLRSDRLIGFDLSRAPLLRLTLIRWDADEWQLVWTFHHAILDGRSFTIVLQEALNGYDALRRGDAVHASMPAPFRAHVEWLERQDWTDSRSFWTATLAGVSAPTPLPGAPGRRSGTARQGDRSVRLSTAATAALDQAADAAEVTLNTMVQGAWALLLSAHAEERDVVFGVVRACRRSSVAGADAMVGLLINTLPLRVVVEPEMALGRWLGKVREQWNELRPVEHTPLPVIQACSEIAGTQSLFETAVMFEDYELEEELRRTGGPWATRGFRLHEQNGFPLTLTAYRGERLTLRIEYDGSRYAAATVDVLLDQLGTLLEAFPRDLTRPLGALSLLSTDARACVVRSFNATSRSYPSGETLGDLLEAQLSRTPERIAVESDAGSLTYAEVHRRAGALARWLGSRGVGRGQLVGVCMERSTELVVALLGILKAGAAWVPLDPEYPPERLAFMLDDAGVSVLLSQRSVAARLPDTPSEVLLVDTEWEHVERAVQPTADVVAATAEDPAYMIYTSGSTGQPKGALNAHRGIVNRLRWMQDEYVLGTDDAVLQKTPISFDVSVWELFWPLITGARLVMARPGGHRDPEYLARVIADSRITVLHFVPSMLRLFLAEGAATTCSTVRDVMCSGEALPVELADRFFAALPAARLHNLYGPTEAAVDVSYWECRRDNDRLTIPIGRPVANTQLYVLDDRLAPAPIGVPGELYIAGVQVGMGYHKRPELTAGRFIADPFSAVPGALMYRTGDRARWLPDGAVDYLGRIDHQVKLHGQRIELGEIESHLAAQPGVAAAVAQLWHDTGGGDRLVAYYVPRDGAEPGAAELRAGLARLLPPGVVPATFVRLNALPLTPNGKLDRSALPPPDAATNVGREHVAARTAAERELVAIWASVLRRTPVGVTDNFFELGGDSILMIQIASRARAAGIQVSLADFFEHPTVAELAARASAAGGATDDVRDRMEPASARLAPVQQWFFETQPEAPNWWNQAFLFEVPADFDLPTCEQALGAVVTWHPALRTRFVGRAGSRRQEVVPDARESALATLDLSDVPRTAQAAAITEACERVQGELDIASGDVFRALHLRTGAGPGRLLLVAHHLVIDGISWRVLLEAFERAYHQLRNGDAVAPATTTATFGRWAEALERFGRSAEAARESGYWEQVTRTPSSRLPVDMARHGPASEADSATISVALTEAETRDLLQRVPAAYKSQINDVLLAALGAALQTWVPAGSLLVDLEGHGREDLPDGADVSHTIGWFTSLFPVRLGLPLAADPGVALQSVKKELRGVPRRGIGYGVLRYLRPGTSHAEDSAAEILFNYLGQLDALVADSQLLRFAPESPGRWRAPQARRTHHLQVDALVIGGRFEIRWAFDRTRHHADTIQRIAEAYLAALRGLIAHALLNQRPMHTPADYPLAALDQPALDRITARLPDVDDIYPVAPIQRLFLGLASAATNDPGFEQWRYRIAGPLDTGRLRDAWRGVVERNAILRTAFVADGMPCPMQVVRRHAELPWVEHDWRDLNAAAQQDRLAALLAADRAAGFVAEQAPMMRMALIRMADDRHDLVWSHHHLLLDRWSWMLVLREVEALYAGSRSTLRAPVPYRNYVSWLGDQDLPAADSFWRGELGGLGEPLEFPRRGQGPGDAPQPAEVRIDMTAAEDAALRRFAATNRLTVNTLVQGAWALWLAHHFDRRDVVFGISVSGRPADVAGMDRMIGMTINNLPVRVSVAPDQPLVEWLQGQQRRVAASQRFGYALPEQIHAASGLAWRHRLFDTLLVFQDALADEVTRNWLGEGVSIEAHHGGTRTRYPLTLVVTGTGRASLRATYDAAYFLQAGVEQLLGDVRSLLSGMVDHPRLRLGQLIDLLGVASRGAGRASGEPPAPTAAYIGPRNAVESVVARVWQELFGREKVGVTENFFALGGHSLLALQLVSRLGEAFRLDVPVRDLFANPTIAGIAAALSARERRSGQVHRIAELMQQVESMSMDQLKSAAAAVAEAPAN